MSTPTSSASSISWMSSSTSPTSPTSVVRTSRATVVGGLLGGAATTCGIALTATSGWLIVRASERPVILTLLAAIVAVRAFGMARPFFRYLERLVSHDAALDDLARRRTAVYAALVPLTPARAQAMLCGNPDMVAETVALLETRGMKKNRRRAPGHLTVETYW